MDFSSLIPKTYDLPIILALFVFIVVGLVSGIHFRRFSDAEIKAYSIVERSTLKLPGIWLSASLWLNYVSNLMLASSTICSLVVVVMTVFENPPDQQRVVVYTLVALSCTYLYNFTHSKEKSLGYRDAYDLINDRCKQFERKYGPGCDFSTTYSESERSKDFSELLEMRNEAEGIIRDAHTYNAARHSDPRSERAASTRSEGESDVGKPPSEHLVEHSSKPLVAPTTDSVLRAVLYYLYPRPGDALKLGFIVFGAALAFSIMPLEMKLDEFAWKTLFVVFVLDYLVYQARYQINDIRGVREDSCNPQAAKRSRLPVVEKYGAKKSIRISLAFAITRIVCAICAIVAASIWWGFDKVFPLVVCLVGVIVIAVLYEYSRGVDSKVWKSLSVRNQEVLSADFCSEAEVEKLKKRSWCTFVLVCLGYPLRFVAGYSFIACFSQTWWDPNHAILVILVLIATAFFGESFVTLTWALEASDLKRKIAKEGLSEHLQFRKLNIAYMAYLLGDSVSCEFPLKSDSPLLRRWNVGMWVSCTIMVGAIVISEAQLVTLSGGLQIRQVLILTIIIAGCALLLVLSACFQKRMLIWCIAGVAIAVISVMVWAAPALLSSTQVSLELPILIAFGLAAYTLIYLFFRLTNYEGMHGSFLESLKKRATAFRRKAFKVLVGNDTFELFLPDSDYSAAVARKAESGSKTGEEPSIEEESADAIL